ncbi:MAG: hypothetical protein ACK56F_02205, partial [bacterium]
MSRKATRVIEARSVSDAEGFGVGAQASAPVPVFAADGDPSFGLVVSHRPVFRVDDHVVTGDLHDVDPVGPEPVGHVRQVGALGAGDLLELELPEPHAAGGFLEFPIVHAHDALALGGATNEGQHVFVGLASDQCESVGA